MNEEIPEQHTLSSQSSAATSPWERDVLEKLVFASVTEQRRTRRWGIFFKILFFLYLLAIAVITLSPLVKDSLSDSQSHTALIDIKGVIADGSEANANKIVGGLRAALKDKGTQGVILRMNTPGGSPVQSDYIFREIRRLKGEYPDIPIYAVVSDICASGGYYIAAAADKIFVNPASLVGSIGVIMNGFGFVDTMHKLGVERRLITAGTHKGMLDPFSPKNAEEEIHMKNLIKQVHQQFIQSVKEGRGDRLQDNPDLFSGLVWTGEESIALGLTDAVGSAGSVARDIIGEEKIINFTPQEDIVSRLSKRLGAALEHILWNTATQTHYQLR